MANHGFSPIDVPLTDPQLEHVLALCRHCNYEEKHTHHVTSLALVLFDQLASLHGYDATARQRLHAGALLHDIGWVEGKKGHHKTALRMILTSPILEYDERERLIVGSIARYHRRALPNPAKHGHYASLDEVHSRLVDVTGGVLRVADALDRTHRSTVQGLCTQVTDECIQVDCSVAREAEHERDAALNKGDLLEQALQRRLVVQCHQT